MTSVLRHIAKHRLNVREGCSPVRQKKRGQAADRNQAIQEEVGKFIEADAYKGYHQIPMANEDEEKTTFITSQGIFCYMKMPFGLRNVGATYQRLVDKAFHKQVGRNLEVYVDDLVIKSHTEEEIVRDIEETIKTLMEINMKLNPKKCTFRVEEGMFLGYKVNSKGQKVCPDKVDAVLSLPSLKCLKDVQKLNGKLASLNRPRVPVKGRILVDFIVERPKEDSLDTSMEKEEKLPEPWILFTNGSSCTDGSGVGLILTNPKGMEFTYALRFRFDATNNEAEYEALIVGLRIAEQMGAKNLQANVDSRLVANQVNGTYVAKEADMVRYLKKVKAMTGGFKAFTIKQIPRSENKKAYALSKIASTSFAHLSKQVLVEELKEKSISKVEVLTVVEEEGDTWMTPIYKYLAEETLPADMKKARAIKSKSWRFAVINGILYKKSFLGPWLRFGLPREIISDNGKQFRDDPFKDWCEKLCINQHFASVKHPQTNGLVERANRSLGEGIKARLEERSKNWMEELPHVLWAHRTMIKSSNGDTPFSLTYGTEAVIPAEIGMPTIRTTEVDLVQNNKALEINLDLLEERRDEAAIRKAKTLGKGAYELRDRDGKQLPQTWNISNLKKLQDVNEARDSVMSSASSVVTYTSVYTDSEPERVFWGADEELSDGGSPRVIVYGYDRLPMQLVALPSPDYVPGPEHPPSPDYIPGPEHPPSPVEIPYVPEPEYPECLVPSDAEAPLEDQPLPIDASPTALSPGYVANSDPEEDPEEDHVDYPAGGGDDDDEPSDDDDEPSDDDDDADDEEEETFDDEEEEEHLAPADPSVIPVVDPVPSAGDTEAVEAEEPAPAHG
ncbi:reverse transcriptase domain-containing protein [Tanacetum coccineum]